MLDSALRQIEDLTGRLLDCAVGIVLKRYSFGRGKTGTSKLGEFPKNHVGFSAEDGAGLGPDGSKNPWHVVGLGGKSERMATFRAPLSGVSFRE